MGARRSNGGSRVSPCRNGWLPVGRARRILRR